MSQPRKVCYYTDAMSEPLTIAAAAPLVRSGELTPSELLEQCLRRIDIYEPAVQAWVYLDRERARRDAQKLTDEAKAGRVRGPLHGVPVGVKDIIDVFDMPTGCGSKLWANSYARRDATVVERLRQAGAIILGKTVTTPYAYLDPPVTRNPWDLTRTPGGSSSGSAAAVACGMCLAALGTQTGGSLTRPASYCGVYSLKPTYGRLSVDGVLPLAPSLDHVGILANCARDLTVVYEVVAGADPAVRGGAYRPVGSALRDVDRAIADRHPFSALLPRDFYAGKLSPEVALMMSRLETDIQNASDGAGTLGVVLPVGFDEVHRHHRLMMATGAATTHAERLVRRPDDYPPRIAELVRDGQAATAAELIAATDLRDRLLDQFDDTFWMPSLLIPATQDAAPADGTTGSPWCNSPWSFLGVPVVSVPVARTADGLPMAVQLINGYFHETSVLTEAARLERLADFNHRLPPVPA